jgi:2-polyprenyl-3-methyl-5-hydroxy-6-metoxy-1,4-benzoquinol methylase
VERLNLYDELHVVDIRNFNSLEKFDMIIALEVLHGLPAGALIHIEGLVKKNGSVVLALPALPSEIAVKGLIKRSYNVYRYLLKGFVLIDLESYDIYLAWQSLRFLRVIKLFLTILMPLLKITRILEKGYILAFK